MENCVDFHDLYHPLHYSTCLYDVEVDFFMVLTFRNVLTFTFQNLFLCIFVELLLNANLEISI